MKLFFRKAFYLLFFLLFIFSFFLIEGEYKLYLFALWSIFLLFFSLVFNEKPRILKPIISALVLSVLFIISVIFSKHIPLSIEKLFFYLISLATFIFFSSISKNKFKPKAFFYYLSILTLVLNAIVLFFTFYQDQQSIFPGMNLLVRSYGHNHYAAFLLLLIPIFWWQFLFKNEQATDKETHFLMIILLMSSYLLIILSLARLVLFISLIQLIAIFFTNKKILSSSKENDFVKIIIKTFIFIFVSIGTVFLFLSVPLNNKGESLCPLVFSKKEICQPLLQNDRFIYWQKAWLVFSENLLVGSGLKNFNFSSRKFPIENYQITSYAHNIFLHNLAEGGLLVGIPFFFFITYIFYRSFLVIKRDREPLYKFLWLAASASLFNAMFDFDWNFFIIFVLTLIFIAIILQNDQGNEIIKIKLFKSYYIFITVAITFIACGSLTAQIFYKKNRPDLIIKYFPYINQQVRLLLNERKLNFEDFSALYPFYKHDAEFIYRFALSEHLTSEKKIALQLELADIDPLAFISTINFDKLDYQTAFPLADKFIEIVTRYQILNNPAFLDYWDQKNFAQQFFNFANQAYLANELKLAANYYRKVLVLSEFMIENERPSFLAETDYLKSVTFLKYFKDSNPEKMGGHFSEYMIFYEEVLLDLFQNNFLDDFFLLADAMFEYQYNFSWFLWRDLVNTSVTKEAKKKLLIVYDRYKDMKTWNDFAWLIKELD